ncbi:MAG: methyltransferase domain-containing protein [Candidatus Wallbacteria bacterium]|nr:methyltransferase domain-containing protein [Candidatus Wallbacteria bacterium]
MTAPSTTSLPVPSGPRNPPHSTPSAANPTSRFAHPSNWLDRFLVPPQTRQLELLDGPLPPRDALLANLRDLALVNRFAGGWAVAAWALERLVGSSSQRSFRVLDIGTGGADVPVALSQWARRRGLALQVDAIDLRHEVVDLARSLAADEPSVRVLQGDALDLGALPQRYDFVLSSLALHHFDPPDAVRFLQAAHARASIALVVNDLRRSRVAWYATRLVSRIFFESFEAKHDGPLSVLRAYTPREVAELARMAGLPGAEVHTRPPFRMCLIARA